MKGCKQFGDELTNPSTTGQMFLEKNIPKGL